MIIQTKNGRQVILKHLQPDDFDKLTHYLQNLQPETTRRFGPHSFDRQTIDGLFENTNSFRGYIALDIETDEVVAYSIIKTGFLEHDGPRLRSYGLTLDAATDCTFAPSVADAWQSMGLGNSLFLFVLSDLQTLGIKRIILWGGVQCSNTRAVNYYHKNGFKTLGQFEYNGENYDMVLDIG
ncbi:MAG: GNAT family N-acetyltransferase [Bacteroidales bacterium]